MNWNLTRFDGKVKNWRTTTEGSTYECALYLSPLEPWDAKPERTMVLIVRGGSDQTYLQEILSEETFDLDKLSKEALAWAEAKISALQ